MKNILIFVFSILLMFFGCNINESKEINIYSQRHYEVDRKQYENFEKKTGIKVNVIKANADELLERLKNEGENSPADLLLLMLENFKKVLRWDCFKRSTMMLSTKT